jgi:hypothetical protein
MQSLQRLRSLCTLGLVVFAAGSSPADARCRLLSAAEAANAAAAVFLGTVDSVTGNEVHLRVHVSWKGHPPGRVVLHEKRPGGSAQFQPGGAYLVYAAKESDGSYSEGLCTRTHRLTGAEDLAALGHASVPAPPSLASWVELGPDGVILARAVMAKGSACPSLLLGAVAKPMQARVQPNDKHPVLVCEAEIPAGTASASLEGHALPLPKKTATRIAIVGDTGCRVKGNDPQACNDPKRWPFAAVAQRIADSKPDLVIHVGDYLYRELECPKGNKDCAGGPAGDGWKTWKADFFAPAKPLLRAAPWVMIRGNHESCTRSGHGWFRYLDPRPMPASCTEYTKPYAVPFADVKGIVLDSAMAEDEKAPADQVTAYAEQFKEISALASDNSWILTHRPIWAFAPSRAKTAEEKLEIRNATLQAASENRLAAGVKLFVAGHVHFFEVLTFKTERAPVLVVGNGGTLLDRPITSPLVGKSLGGAEIAFGEVKAQGFGFVTMSPSGMGWIASLRDVEGNETFACKVDGFSAKCAADHDKLEDAPPDDVRPPDEEPSAKDAPPP